MKIKFSRTDQFRKVLTINDRKFHHFDISNIPDNFGCLLTKKSKEGISSFINYKGLTYYAE